MTIPYLMNCPHSGDGWCLECVAALGHDAIQLRTERDRLKAFCEKLAADLYKNGDPFNGGDWQLMQDVRTALGLVEPKEC
jgi:hypothetical protein